jgi:hypothetical protein
MLGSDEMMNGQRRPPAFPADDEFPNVGGIEADGAAYFYEFEFPAFYEAVQCTDGNLEHVAYLLFLPKIGHG